MKPELLCKDLKILEGRMDRELKAEKNVVFTYGDLKDYLNEMTEEELQQPVQVFPPHNTDDVVELHPVYCIETVEKLCSGAESGEQLQETRGCSDNKHHPDHYVLLADHNPFSEEGDTSYLLEDDLSMTGDKTGIRKYHSKASLELTEDKKTVEAVYISLLNKNKKSVLTKELIPSQLLVDYNKDGQLVGIEILTPFAFREENGD